MRGHGLTHSQIEAFCDTLEVHQDGAGYCEDVALAKLTRLVKFEEAAMRFHAKLEDFIDMIHVYPTMAEALKIAAISYFKDPAKLSCCAE